MLRERRERNVSYLSVELAAGKVGQNLSQCKFQSTLCIFRRRYMLIPQIRLLGTRGVSVFKKKNKNVHMNDARVHRLTVTVSCVCEGEQEETWARGMG